MIQVIFHGLRVNFEYVVLYLMGVHVFPPICVDNELLQYDDSVGDIEYIWIIPHQPRKPLMMRSFTHLMRVRNISNHKEELFEEWETIVEVTTLCRS